MTNLRTKSGPMLSPISLERQLESAVAFEREAWLQLNCLASHSLSTEYQRSLVHLELEKVLSRG